MSDSPRVKPEKGHFQRAPGGKNGNFGALTVLPTNEVSQQDVLGDEERARKFATAKEAVISRKPHLDEELKSAHIISFLVLKRIEETARRTNGDLSDEDMRAFVRIAGEVLPKIIREEREIQKAEKLEDMDEAEFLRLADEARRVLAKEND